MNTRLHFVITVDRRSKSISTGIKMLCSAVDKFIHCCVVKNSSLLPIKTVVMSSVCGIFVSVLHCCQSVLFIWLLNIFA